MHLTLKHKLRISVAAALLPLAATGCAMTFNTASLGVPVSMASPGSQAVVGDTFDIRTSAMFALWGLMPSRVPSLQKTLEGQLAGGRAVKNLEIRVWHRWSDVLITVLSGGLLDPVTVSFQGIVTDSSS